MRVAVKRETRDKLNEGRGKGGRGERGRTASRPLGPQARSSGAAVEWRRGTAPRSYRLSVKAQRKQSG